MRALTLHQPVASMMGHQPLKSVENRKWKPHASVFGQRIAIHAGKKWNAEYAAWARGVSKHDRACEIAIHAAIRKAGGISAAIVSTAVVSAWYDKRDGKCEWTDPATCLEFIKDDPWFQGPVGWLLTDFIQLPKPIPCRGALGLWTIPENIQAVIE
ncbi:hypothetical protein LCGC14_0319720 [marine sediment metagenome]|uniref:ASCH domain-containing protein n=1 Tax=marine sediment metagenome TaxID=412755 RepID=A0A0F9TPX7_9ZZZZ